jgi:predicted NBD/HSP70 family sugar kinase
MPVFIALLRGINVTGRNRVPMDELCSVCAGLGWRDVATADWMEDALGLPTVVDHNVRAMAVAEAQYGSARGAAAALYVYLRTGVGAGFVLHGRPFHGVTHLGHVRVVEKGKTCRCGATGCLETVVGERHLREQVVASGAKATRLMRAVEASPTVYEDMIDHFTTGLASAVNLLNPDLILLGGLFTDASDATFGAISNALRAKAFPALGHTVPVKRSHLGKDVGVVGGAAIALDRLFYAVEEAEGAGHVSDDL